MLRKKVALELRQPFYYMHYGNFLLNNEVTQKKDRPVYIPACPFLIQIN